MLIGLIPNSDFPNMVPNLPVSFISWGNMGKLETTIAGSQWIMYMWIAGIGGQKSVPLSVPNCSWAIPSDQDTRPKACGSLSLSGLPKRSR